MYIHFSDHKNRSGMLHSTHESNLALPDSATGKHSPFWSGRNRVGQMCGLSTVPRSMGLAPRRDHGASPSCSKSQSLCLPARRVVSQPAETRSVTHLIWRGVRAGNVRGTKARKFPLLQWSGFRDTDPATAEPGRRNGKPATFSYEKTLFLGTY